MRSGNHAENVNTSKVDFSGYRANIGFDISSVAPNINFTFSFSDFVRTYLHTNPARRARFHTLLGAFAVNASVLAFLRTRWTVFRARFFTKMQANSYSFTVGFARDVHSSLLTFTAGSNALMFTFQNRTTGLFTAIPS